MGFISFFAIITLAVAWHELGHLIAARMCGITVEKFAVGFGPKLISTTDGKGTEWSLRLFLIGGYIRPDHEQVAKARTRQRVFIYAMGPIFSIAPFFAALLAGLNLQTPELFPENQECGSFVMIYDYAAAVLAGGWKMWIAGLLTFSVVLGGCNLVPIPPLDGGRIALAILGADILTSPEDEEEKEVEDEEGETSNASNATPLRRPSLGFNIIFGRIVSMLGLLWVVWVILHSFYDDILCLVQRMGW